MESSADRAATRAGDHTTRVAAALSTPRDAEHASGGGAGETSAFDMLPGLVQFGALVAFCQNYVITSMQCAGPSMLPTLGLSGDIVLMWPTASGLITPQLGDVVICTSVTDPTSTVCKRIAGMPGDIVRYRWKPGMIHSSSTLVPPGQCWLHGDNSNDSTDSRYYGSVPLALIKGVVFMKLWPLSEARWISRTPPRAEEMAAVQQQQQQQQQQQLREQRERQERQETDQKAAQPRRAPETEDSLHASRASAPAIRQTQPQPTPEETAPEQPMPQKELPQDPVQHSPSVPKPPSAAQQQQPAQQPAAKHPPAEQEPLSTHPTQPPPSAKPVQQTQQQTQQQQQQQQQQQPAESDDNHRLASSLIPGSPSGAPQHERSQEQKAAPTGEGLSVSSDSERSGRGGDITKPASSAMDAVEEDEYSEALAAAAWRARMLQEQPTGKEAAPRP